MKSSGAADQNGRAPGGLTTTATLLGRLGAPSSTALGLLRELELRGGWRGEVETHQTLVRSLISEGCAAEAFDLACEGLSMHAADPTLEYLRALALDRGGNPRLASEYVVELLGRELSGSLLKEALSLAGKADKRKCQQAGDQKTMRECASASAVWYERAYQLTGDHFPGINAAAMSLLAGERLVADQRARDLITAFAQTDPETHDFWLLATLGEAQLIAGNAPAALTWYRRAVERAADRTGDLGSMLFDLRMLGTQVSIDPELLALFNLGRVVAFAGHMIDRPGRVARRFPAEPNLVLKVKV